MLEIIDRSDFQILHDAAAFIFTLTNQIQHSYDDCLYCQSTLGTERPSPSISPTKAAKKIFEEI